MLCPGNVFAFPFCGAGEALYIENRLIFVATSLVGFVISYPSRTAAKRASTLNGHHASGIGPVYLSMLFRRSVSSREDRRQR